MKSKLIYGILVLSLVTVAVFGAYYSFTTEAKIAQLSDNLTVTKKNFDLVYAEYAKLAAPKMFQNEDDLIKWLTAVKDQSLTGYINQARLDGVAMEIWMGWVDGKSSVSGIDFGDSWKATKSVIVGTKYALITVVDGKTFIIDPVSKKIISFDLETKNGTWVK
jgi:hypothetical protein